MRNPLRDEGAAFRFVLFVLAASAAIALASWIETWFGLGVALALAVLAVVGLRGGRERRDQAHVTGLEDGVRRVLVIANETLEGRDLVEAVRERVGVRGEVMIVAPALNTRVRLWASDEDDARAAAASRLEASLARLVAAGLTVTGAVGDSDPVQRSRTRSDPSPPTRSCSPPIRRGCRTGSNAASVSASRSGSTCR